MVEMKVNPGELAAGGRGLEEAANSIPEPLAPFTSTGADALSQILASLTQEKESPLIAGLPATKAEAQATARNIVTAAGMYERSDQQIATDVQNATAKLDGAGGAGSASGSGAGPLQQLMSMPMQMAQQAGQMAGQVAKSVGQLPQTMMQGVQSGIQQIGQLAGDAGRPVDGAEPEDLPGKAEDDERKPAEAPTHGAGQGVHGVERAPDGTGLQGAVASSPKHARGVDPETLS